MAATAFCVPFTPCISEPRARPCICVSRGALRSPIRLKKPLQLLSFHNSNTYVLHKKPSVRCHSSSSSSYESVEDKFSGEFFFRQIFVTGLSFRTTEENLQKCFSCFGKIVSVRIIRNSFTKRSKGFGFITYATEEDANTAIKEMNGKVSYADFECLKIMLTILL
eukprot:TRINITY_DN223_c0_g1_i8.p1 TRINITY_DN223_c0_g1~~TRINITY_DN223_c0_g1_i8.p1  ORF type:complete len:165 (+),score=16.87 TRINITY_DN223_c0_g1_i8:157-651(+)